MPSHLRRSRRSHRKALRRESSAPAAPSPFGEALSHPHLGASLPLLSLSQIEAICSQAEGAADSSYWEYPSSRRRAALFETALRERLDWGSPLPSRCRLQSDASVSRMSGASTLFGIGWAFFSEDNRLASPGLANLQSLEPVSFGSSAMEAEALGLFVSLSRARSGGVRFAECHVDCLALERLVLDAEPLFPGQSFGSVGECLGFAARVWEDALPSSRLSSLCSLAAGQLRALPSFSLAWTPRGENKIADSLARLSSLLPPDATARASVESRARARSASRLVAEDGRVFAFGLCELETPSGSLWGRSKVLARGDAAAALAASESHAIAHACSQWPERDRGALLARSAALDALRLDESLLGQAKDVGFAWLGFPERERILSALDAQALPGSPAFAPRSPSDRPEAFFSFAARLASWMRPHLRISQSPEPPEGGSRIPARRLASL